MKEITVKVKAPEGCEPITTVLKDGSVKIDWKKIDNRPKSWEEYQKLVVGKDGYNGDSTVFSRGTITSYNTFNTAEECMAFVALGKLIQLRDAWWGDWRPDWTNNEVKYSILFAHNFLHKDWKSCNISYLLTFPSAEMSNEFYRCFKDLIEEAKMLL